jgi:hypothetical protein
MTGPKIDWNRMRFEPDYDSQAWWDFTGTDKLMVRSCNKCDHKWWPPGVIGCANCGEYEDVGWIESNGKGFIYTYVVAVQPMLAAFVEAVPYVTAVVELDGIRGSNDAPVRMWGVVDESEDEIGINAKVQVYFEETAQEGMKVPRWRLDGPAGSDVWKFPN